MKTRDVQKLRIQSNVEYFGALTVVSFENRKTGSSGFIFLWSAIPKCAAATQNPVILRKVLAEMGYSQEHGTTVDEDN